MPAHVRKPAPFDAREPACCQTVFEKVVAEDGNEERADRYGHVKRQACAENIERDAQ
jgi:hypothetical protein